MAPGANSCDVPSSLPHGELEVLVLETVGVVTLRPLSLFGSKTADIEHTLAYSVHSPKWLVVVLVPGGLTHTACYRGGVAVPDGSPGTAGGADPTGV
jgi:hypothetical protein